MSDLLLAIDQGTSSTRAIAFDRRLRPVASASVRLATTYPRPGWVEQDPSAILGSVVDAVGRVVDEIGGIDRVAAAGLDNQGETVIAWDAEDGRALAPAIGWQCRRSLDVVERLRSAGLEEIIRARTGLPLDPYYSAGKMTWLLEHDSDVRAAAARGSLRLGTVDAWLTARLDRGRARTDPSTASRTQLFGLKSLDWEDDLIGWFGVRRDQLPRIVPTVGDLGELAHRRWGGAIPLRAMACDQQAALAGHGGFASGSVKATHGTGVFVVANAGASRVASSTLETSIGWALSNGPTTTVLQGGLFAAGAFIDWLRNELSLIDDPAEISQLASSVPDAGGVRILPALAGLGPPWWRPRARGAITGLTAAAGRAQVVRAALDGIAHGVADLIEAMGEHLGVPVDGLRVDGGLTANAYLMQREADLVGVPVHVATAAESTALGIAGLAGIALGWIDPDDIARANPVAVTYEATGSRAERVAERDEWRRFVEAVADL